MKNDNPIYPRPDFQRSQLRWNSLNGPWDFFFDDNDVGLNDRWQHHALPAKVNNQEKRTIQVPFVFQSPASGINDRGVHEVLWYERNIQDLRSSQEMQRGDRALLRFGAVDYEAIVWVNGIYTGFHRGGHVPFDVDITEALESNAGGSTHRLTVRVYDSAYDLTQPRGKQYWKPQPESIFYTPSGGIWQTVWQETVPATRIADSSNGTVLKSNDIKSGQLHAKVEVSGKKAAQPLSIQVECSIGGTPVSTTMNHDMPNDKDYARFDVDMHVAPEKAPKDLVKTAPLDDPRCWLNGVALWSPEKPLLYDLKLKLLDGSGQLLDEVQTTTGMRSLDWTKGDGTFRLNGQPYFQALVLDQGYWKETFMTPPSPEALKTDIEMSKNMGFNGCRKHQKVEDPIFLYWADKLGYLVWGEMANAYQFDENYVARFNQEWIESVKRDINHPCVVTWTPVNESWGYTDLGNSVDQRNHIRALYYITKSLDDTRSINDNCGWEHVLTDLSTFHDYADGPVLADTCSTLGGVLSPKSDRVIFTGKIPDVDDGAFHKYGAPILCTEFGGVNIAPQQGEKKGQGDWGYTTASDPADLLMRVKRLIMGVVAGGHCCGFVYTQLTDIEQEVNGLYSFDRRAKLNPVEVKAVMDEAQKLYYKLQQENQTKWTSLETKKEWQQVVMQSR